MIIFHFEITFRSYQEQESQIQMLDDLVQKLDNETNEFQRLAAETRSRFEELNSATLKVFLSNFHPFSNV